jgi:hypothetical protein
LADETVRQRLEFDASQAIQAMKDVQEQAETTAGKAQLLAQKVADYSRSLGQSWRTTLAQMREQVGAGSSPFTGFSTPLGLDVTNSVFKNTEATLKNAQAKDKYITADTKAAAATRNFAGGIKSATGQLSLFGHGIDVVKTALGTLTAVAIFQFLTMLSQFFQGATKAARELEDSLYRVINVEKELSGAGIEVTTEGLLDGITKLKKQFPIFSKEDLTGLVGGLAIKTKDLEYSEKQILDLAAAIAVLNVRSTEVETLDQTTGKVVTALLSGTTKGISGLGLQMDDATIRAEAMAEGLLKAGEGVEDLSKSEKDLVKLNIVLKSTGEETIAIQKYLKSSAGIIQQNTAAWRDLQSQVGTFLTSVVPLLTPLIKTLESGVIAIKSMVAALNSLGAIIPGVVNAWKEFFDFADPNRLQNFVAALKDIPNQMKELLKIRITDMFPQAPDSPLFEKLFGDFFEYQDTPTSPLAGVTDETIEDAQNIENAVAETEEKITDIMAEARDKRAKIDEDYRRKIEDANRDHAQKMQDIARDVERKQEDALRNYNQKVEDINRNAAESVAEAQADYREREVEREQDYQRRLQELRERFLMNLEDALRERDARQVLRLIREYNLEKKQLAEKRKSEGKDAERDLARKLADIERERLLKLEAARRELAEKQAEIALWAERERQDAAIALQRKLADARRWHQLELQEYQQYLRRKLEELARSIVREYQLTAAGAQAIYQLLNGYFGAGGAVAGLMNGLSASLNGVLSSSSSGGSVGTNTNPGFAGSGMYGTYAEGGTYVATRPTKAIFGERGPEMATFTPINRTGQDVNKLFGDISPGGNGGNSIDLRVSLSRDLIAEVVDATLDTVALHLERLGRER